MSKQVPEAPHSSLGRGEDLRDGSEYLTEKTSNKNTVKQDPFMIKAFSFYNSHIRVQAEDKVPILKDNVVNYY